MRFVLARALPWRAAAAGFRIRRFVAILKRDDLSLSVSPKTRVRAAVAIVGVLTLALSACGSGSSPSKKSSASASASASPSASASSSGAPAPAAPPKPAAGALFPAVAGSFGQKPTLSFPTTKPSTKLQVKVLSTGSGPTVVKNNLIIVNYLGQIWQGKDFDNSYDSKAPLGTAIGAGKVIKGWDDALVGKKVGSRVLMVIPPAEGYGSAGQSAAGIKGTDTLAFVVDIIAQYSKSDIGDTKAVVQKVSTAPVTVTGALGTAPKITVAKEAAAPTAPKTTVLAKSTGKAVTPGTVVLQYVVVDFTGTLIESTFAEGQPQATQVAAATSGGSAFDGIIGVPIGSRVLIVTQVQSQTGTATPVAIVADIVGELPAS
jgi:peptidylprolyl isomerase